MIFVIEAIPIALQFLRGGTEQDLIYVHVLGLLDRESDHAAKLSGGMANFS
jgi:hypothetical protein